MVILTALATGEPEGILYHHNEHDYSPDNPDSPRIKATLLSLVRNEELNELIPSMRELEKTWNSKFNYPWTFFNDVPFTDEFKRRTQAETKAKCNYGKSHRRFINIVAGRIPS